MTRRSLPARLRGWISDDEGAEQQLKDLTTFHQGVRRRWWIIGVGALFLLLGRTVGLVAVGPGTILLVIAGAVIANLLVALVLRTQWYRWWEIYLFALLDVLLAAALIVVCGPGGLIAVFFVAALPYAFDQGRAMGDVLVLATTLAYLGAAALHGSIVGVPLAGPWILSTSVYLEALLFIVVALALTRIPGNLMQRMRLTRSIMAHAEIGDFSRRAPADTHDELGLLERSFNHMLEEIAATIAEVQREADEVAAFADVLAESAGRMLASSQTVAGTAGELAKEMSGQRERADAGHHESTAAAREAESLRSRAAAVADDARRLVEAAERGRERVGRASETLVAIGEDVRGTAATVGKLSGISERIGRFAQAIGRIARQTHLLALNAAIEAARAAEHGHGFAVVADQVRALAGEAARSAREVVDLITEVRAGIDAVATAMATGEEKVRDVGLIADEAQTAFDDLHRGVAQAAQVVADTAAISRSEAERMAMITQEMSEVAAVATRSSAAADSAARAMSEQIRAMGDLNDASRQLAQLAERLRASIGRFSLLPRERATGGYRTPEPG